MKIRLVCCALLGLLISPAMADIAVTLEPAGPRVGEVYADIPLADAIVGFGLDAIVVDGGLTYAGFTPGPDFSPAGSLDGDGFAGMVFPPDVVYGSHVLLGTLTFNGSVGSNVDLGYTATDLTEGLALPGVGGFAAAAFTGAFITPEPASLILLALGALALRRR